MILPLIMLGVLAVAWAVMKVRRGRQDVRRILAEAEAGPTLLRDERGHVICDEAGMPVEREIES